MDGKKSSLMIRYSNSDHTFAMHCGKDSASPKYLLSLFENQIMGLIEETISDS